MWYGGCSIETWHGLVPDYIYGRSKIMCEHMDSNGSLKRTALRSDGRVR